MDKQAVWVELPSDIYEPMQRLAQQRDSSVENVLIGFLKMLISDEFSVADLTPEQLESYSDEELWAIVWRPLATSVDLRLQELSDLADLGKLTDTQREEMARLVAEVDHYVLIRSKALVTLKKRGHDVESRLRQGA
ncbi:MAG: hypothetical protein BroJett018_49200 [Chloroflexota bacterium]|nr:MAG: hypothetical protein BroJett018_49200 [Chloroflexota bacterium]